MARTTETPARCCSIGIDENPTPKEEISNVHGNRSRQMRAVNQLEEMLADSETSGEASRKFNNFIRHHLPRPYHSERLADEFTNSGYIIALERLRAPNSARNLDFYERYATRHGTSVSAAMLFGPNGSAREAFSRWRVAEALRGQHRSSYRPADAQRYNRKLWMACVKKAAYPFELKDSTKTQMKGHATWKTVRYRTPLCQSVPRML